MGEMLQYDVTFESYNIHVVQIKLTAQLTVEMKDSKLCV